VFLAIFHVLIVLDFQFSAHTSGPTVCISLFPRFECSSPYSRSNSVYFSFFRFSCDSQQISSPTVCFSHFQWFSVFSPYSSSYSVHLLFSTFFSVSRHIPGPTMLVSHSPPPLFFSVFSSYSRSYSVHFSFSRFSVFLTIFHVLEYVFLIFHYFQFSPQTASLTVCISLISCFSVSLAIFHVL